MKILSIHPYSTNLNVSSSVVSHNKKISFTSGIPSKLLKEVINADSSKLKVLGEMFHKEYPSDAMYETLGLYHAQGKICSKGMEILNGAREQVNKHRKEISASITTLSQKNNIDAENLIKAKNKITNNFIDIIKAETDRSNVTKGIVPNGILIYGNNVRVNNELLEHTKKANVNYKEINFDLHNPFKSIEKLLEAANTAKNAHELTNRRTLINFKFADQLFNAPKTFPNQDALNAFEQIISITSDKYKTTILVTTTKNFDYLNAPRISKPNFDLKIKNNLLLSDKELLKLITDKAEIARLDEMAEKGRKINQQEKIEYDEALSLERSSMIGW